MQVACEGHPHINHMSYTTGYQYVHIALIPRVVAYDNIIPVEGSTISFSCPPGLELVGPNCIENGEWGPDLSGMIPQMVSDSFYYCDNHNLIRIASKIY